MSKKVKAGRTRPTASRRPGRGKTRSRGGPQAEPQILVVDDERAITQMLACALQRRGYTVFQANGAAEAMRIAEEETIDAALIDVRMPGAGGFCVLENLKANDERLVAVMMTGYADLDGARQAMRSGAYDYITKPFDMNALRTILAAGLAERAQAGEQGRRADAEHRPLMPPES